MTARSHRAAWPSLDQLWGLATVALLMLRVQTTPIAPNDFWWHLAVGRQIVATGQIPLVDHFSFTRAGMPYYNQPWLAQTLMYAVYRLGGVEALAALQALVIGGAYALLYQVSRREGAGPRLAALLTLTGTLVAMDNWQIRPQTYAVPLFVGALAVLLRWRRALQAPLWLLPLLMVIWVNLHGTFVLLPLLCAAVGAGALLERRRADWPGWRPWGTLAGWTLAALLATLLNPRGPAVYGYVFGLVGDRAVAELVTEWASPLRDLDSPMTVIFWILLAGFGALLIVRRRRITSTVVLLTLPFLALALQSVRNILWFGIVSVPITTWLLAASGPARPRVRVEIVALNRAIAALLLALLIATLPWWKEALGLPPQLGRLLTPDTPVEAVRRLQALPARPQRLFHEMGFGSYLIWAAPEQRVFVDPRIELYSYDQWRDYIALGQGRRLEELTTRYGFDGWLVSPRLQKELVAALEHNPRWQRVFSTDEAVFFAPARVGATQP
ncbi:hypothetical protein [Kallotenue papyrolyticum]|uniref:hypothetical protein n=1 Tax=Kallotenue papyrolyticum TaxID=1325125 RepID=UPI000492CDDA|nr:hypothetical protein [Kallotenue papyrolyticum]